MPEKRSGSIEVVVKHGHFKVKLDSSEETAWPFVSYWMACCYFLALRT